MINRRQGLTPNQSPKLRLQRQRDEVAPKLASSILTIKASCLLTHTNRQAVNHTTTGC